MKTATEATPGGMLVSLVPFTAAGATIVDTLRAARRKAHQWWGR